MLIAVLARFLFEISMADTDLSSMQYNQKRNPLGLNLYCVHFISVSKTRSAYTSVLRCGTYRITNTTSN